MANQIANVDRVNYNSPYIKNNYYYNALNNSSVYLTSGRWESNLGSVG